MKCDTDPVACQPCRQKNLRCYTTDRVTGRPRERGQSDRAENEALFLRDQVLAYQTKYGPLQPEDMRPPPPEPQNARVVSSTYTGWPPPDATEPLFKGPVNGSTVDIMDGLVDVCDFPSEMMDSPGRGQLDIYNLSRTSIINTIFGFQRVTDPRMPTKEDALREVDQFLVVMSQYVPILHRPTMREQTARLYDQPDTISLPERVQILAVLGILAYQQALRNHVQSADNFAKSHRFIHCALGFYRSIYHDISLPAMQALALLVVHFRNLPKPGVSWSFSNQVLVRLIELRYHRDPDKLALPASEKTPLAKELRKRVFHSVLAICTTTGCRLGLPAPWQYTHMDVPLPEAILDSELSIDGFSERSGNCDFHPCLHLSRQLPLLTELFQNVTSVRRTESEYLRNVEALNTKILAWKQHWEDLTKDESTSNPNLHVATLLVEQWAAEYQMILHHPTNNTSTSPEVMDRHLDVCHRAAKRVLQSFHTLSNKYKGVDFTWHSVQAYAMGFGLTLYVYKKRKAPVTRDQYQSMVNELNGWMSVMAYTDVVLKTNNHMQRIFQPRRQALDDEYRDLIIDPVESGQSQTPYQQGIGPVNPIVKRDPSNHPTPTQKPMNPPMAFENMQQSPAMHTSTSTYTPSVYATPQRPQQSQAQQAPYPQNAWQQSPHQAPAPYPPNMQQSYTAYHQQSPHQPVSQPSPYIQHQQIPVPVQVPTPHTTTPMMTPTDATASGYPTYLPQQPPASAGPSPQHIPGQVGGNAMRGPVGGPVGGAPQGQMVDYSQMAFNQTHYYGDGSGSLNWPMITMPPGQGQR
jgi:hypothetical protein